jgi:hypothetical protein
VDLGASGAVVTNYGTGTVSYSDTADPFVAEGTIAPSASATLTGTQFFRAAAGAVLNIAEADVSLGSLEEIRAQLLAVRSSKADLTALTAETSARGSADTALGNRATALEAVRAVVSLKDPVYGLALDGVTDDAAAFAAANTAATALGAVLLGPEGKTMLINSQITVTASISGKFTIKKKSTMTASAMLVTGNNLTFRDFTLDGNRSGGATLGGIDWRGSGGKMYGVTTHSNKAWGVNANGGVLDCYGCKSYNNVSGTGATAGSADGFFATAGGVLRCHDCHAYENDRAGVLFLNGAGAGCHWDGRCERNFTGADCRSSAGTIGQYVGVQNQNYDVTFGNQSANTSTVDWNVDSILSLDCGLGFTSAAGAVVANNTSASAVELFGASNNNIDAIMARRPLGYGLAISITVGPVGSSDNHFGTVVVDTTGGVDSDPAYHLSGVSLRNHVGLLIAKGSTVAWSMGEGVAGAPQHNFIGTLIAESIPYGIWSNGVGSYNTIDRVIARDCYNVSAGTIPGLFTHNGAGLTGNVVNSFVHRTVSNPIPNAILTQIGGATKNIVRGLQSEQVGVTAPDSPDVSPLAAAVTANRAYLARFTVGRPTRVVRIAFMNPSTTAAAGDTVDVGIYDSSLTKLVSSGAVVPSSGGTLATTGRLTVIVSATMLIPGETYFAAISFSVATVNSLMANWVSVFGTQGFGTAADVVGCHFMAAAHPLPATITSAGQLVAVPRLWLFES